MLRTFFLVVISFLIIILLIDLIIVLTAIPIIVFKKITQNKPKDLLHKLEIGIYSETYVDEETNVMYLFLKECNAIGLTTMLNENGKPKISGGTKYYTINISNLEKRGLYSKIYVDEETDVMYLFVKDEYAGDLTIMLNADGTPKLSAGTNYDTIKILDECEYNSYCEIYVDEETNVMYLFSKNAIRSGLTRMVNANGTPKLSVGTNYDTIKVSSLGKNGVYYEIYVDEETDIMYLFIEHGNSGGFTMMVNADGTPKLSAGTKYDTINLSKVKWFYPNCKDNCGSYKEIYVDGENNVMYLFLKNEYSGGLATMFNGKYPKTQ